MKGKFRLRRRTAALTTIAALALAIVPLAIAGAISSTTNPAADNGGTGNPALCMNGGSGANTGSGAVNCNIYTAKQYVWLSGLPDSASLDAGTYFFAVLDPGGQRNPNDGTAGNLSDDTDPYTNREFTIDGSGNLTTSGTHDVPGNRIRVGVSPPLVDGGPNWFADTDNNGGVYILAVCQLPAAPVADSPGVNPKDCKYDAFKISQTPTTPPSADLGVSKDAAATLARDYDWSVVKDQTTSSTPINSGDTSVTVGYRVKATWSVGTDTYGVSGTIHVNNPNSYDVTGVAVSDDILDETADTCTVQNGSYTDGSGSHTVSHTNGTIPAGVSVDYTYSCTYSAAPGSNDQTNRATATWDASNALPNTSATGDASFSFPSPTVTHDTTTVQDAFNGGAAETLGVANVNGTFTTDGGNSLDNWADSYDSNTKTFTFTYTRSVPVVRGACTKYDNTATISDDATSGDNSDGASVTVCGPLDLGVTKSATATFGRDYDWSVIKDQTTSSASINSVGSSVTVAYRIKATWSGPTDTYGVSGTIHVNNPNSSIVTGVGNVTGVAVTDNIINETADTCTVQDGSYTDGSGTHTVSHTSGTIPAGVTVDYAYSCTYSSAPASNSETNRATATWDASNNLPHTTATGDASFSFPSPTITHNTTTVKDAFNGGAAQTLGVANVSGTFTKDNGNNLANWASSYSASTKTFTLTYTRSVAVVRNTCTTYNNVATVSDDATSGDNSDGASVTVCGPANTGALTMGFWKNTNGQLVVNGYCQPTGKTSLAAWLSSTIGGPFAGASSYTTCSSLYTNFILPIFNGANASVMTTMLRAQMLATALDVYFSDPNLGWVQQPSGSKTKYPSNFLPGTALGGWKMNLTAICPMVDNLSTGTAACTNNNPSTNAVAAKAFPSSPMAMLSILQYAAGAYVEVGGWYSVEAASASLALKTEQEVAKNVFDQFNNQLAFGSF